jgi:hypothetical protein
MWFAGERVLAAMILLFLIMRRTPAIRELIVATPLSLSSPSATGLSAHAPAQRAGAQRLRALAQRSHSAYARFLALTARSRARPSRRRRAGTFRLARKSFIMPSAFKERRWNL